MKEPHIKEFTAKKGNGLHIRVTTTRKGRRIAIDGGRLYYKDYGTKADTLRAARKIRDEILDDLDLHPTKYPTLKELYETSYELMPLSLASHNYYDSLFIHFPSAQINQVTLEDIQRSVSKYAMTHTQARVKRYISLWKRIYKTAFMLQIPVVDYPSMVSTPKSRILPKHNSVETTYEDFMNFLDQISVSTSFYAKPVTYIAWIMYYTGMRIQEVLALYESDIDLERKLIHVRRSIGSTAFKTAEIVPLKTEKSRRDIPIAPALIPVLEKCIAECEKDLLFTDEYGRPLSIYDVSKYVTRIKKTYNINFTLYSLRHLFAADLFRQGTNPKVIQTLLGHSSENMSLYYAFTTDAERIEAIAKRKPS